MVESKTRKCAQYQNVINYTKTHPEPSVETKEEAISSFLCADEGEAKKKACDALIGMHLWMIARIVKRFCFQYGIYAESVMEDLVHTAIEPMVACLKNFDASLGGFEPYAEKAVANSLKEQHHRNKLIYLPGTARQELKHLVSYFEEHPGAGFAEACENIDGFKRDGVAKAVRLFEVGKSPASIDRSLGNGDEGDGVNLADCLVADDSYDEEALEAEAEKSQKAQIAHSLICEALVEGLRPRSALVLVLYNNITIDESVLMDLVEKSNVVSTEKVFNDYKTKCNFTLDDIGELLLNRKGETVSRQGVDQLNRSAKKAVKKYIEGKYTRTEIASFIR